MYHPHRGGNERYRERGSGCYGHWAQQPRHIYAAIDSYAVKIKSSYIKMHTKCRTFTLTISSFSDVHIVKNSIP